ncbi:conserved hypothetical protein [Tenacibaculum maritimum]|uniref:TrlF family AAA-like ATPase n=1 Tax=Tenacibaculum maritimum TaxID=107401 RepID=UPI0012E54F6A|nr:hypothetical protein [Tenacibaculum maritimum]CAA0252812.1 conserved hypothetical protein [Tenacibaculum maritimum]
MENRGSVWRKWDLHIHSPYSHGTSNKYKEATIEEFCNKILQKQISVIGLTNYFWVSTEEYDEVTKQLGDKCFVIPNFEFRVSDKNKKGQYINAHILFNPKISLSKIHKSLSRVKLCNEEAKYCNLEDIKSVGLDSVYVDLEDLLKVLKRDFKEIDDFLISMPYYGYGGFKQDEKPRSIKMELNYDKKTQIIFGNKSAEDIFCNDRLYELRDDDNNVVKNIQTKIKPTLKCSDAHELEKINDYTWIKAEPTFEGLKQIIYEPKLRCKIQKENPNNKIPHKCIKSVAFKGLPKMFIKNEISFNNDLNTVIGGKSSGKSLLLYYIANTIDYKYAFKQLNPDKKNAEDKSKDKYGFSEQEIFDFEIIWNDDVTYKFSERETIKDRKFVYIPQSYILNLTDNIRSKSRKTLGKFIRDILLQDEKSNELYKEFLKAVKELDDSRDNHIDSYFKNEDAIQVLEAEKKEIGDKEGIKNYIKSQNTLLQTLKKNSNVSDKELNRYNSLNNRLEKINTYSSDLDLELKEIRETIEQYKSSFSNEYDAEDFDYNSAKEFIKRYNQIVLESNKKLDVLDASILKKESLNETRVNGLKQIIKDELKPITSKLKEKTKINAIEDTIKKEKVKLSRIEKIEELINGNHTEKRAKIKSEIIQFYKDAYDEYDKIIEVLNKRGQDFEDINLIGTVKFYHKRYRENLLPFFNKNSVKTKELLDTNLCKDHGNLLPEVLYDNYIKEIESVFDKIVNDELPFTKHREKKDCVKALFKDEFFDYWELRIKNDEMANMSPGKANLVILKLLVELSESDAPILIDQPEDNLDNRSIYRDLVQFLRKRKVDRQIIIVSHNPNIVVSADSENVIVANQSDQDEGRDNKHYRFEYINGALENSFKLSEDEKEDVGILTSMGIREHVTDILEGGEEAFLKREEKYGF